MAFMAFLCLLFFSLIQQMIAFVQVILSRNRAQEIGRRPEDEEWPEMAMLTACCLVGIMLAGCSDSTSGKQAGEEDQAAMTFTQGKALSAPSLIPAVADMKGVAENGQLRLFVDDQTGAIAVLNKHSGDIWHSNPPDRSGDTLATGVNKDLLVLPDQAGLLQ